MATLYIPLNGKEGEYVALTNSDLQNTPLPQLLTFLIREKVPQEIWLKVALAFEKMGRREAYWAIMNIATGSKQRRGYGSFSSTSALTEAGNRLFNSDEETSLLQSWNRSKSSNYDSGYSISVLFASMASSLLYYASPEQEQELEQIFGSPSTTSSDTFVLSASDKEKKRRDLISQSTWYLQMGEASEKSKFEGESSEWSSKLVSGLIYFMKAQYDKSLLSFKNSQSLRETRASRIGMAICLMKLEKNAEALNEFSKVLISIFASKQEPIKSKIESMYQNTATGGSNQTTSNLTKFSSLNLSGDKDAAWFYDNISTVLQSDYSSKSELLHSFTGLLPSMSLCWARLGNTTRAIQILNAFLNLIEDARRDGFLFNSASSKHGDNNTTLNSLDHTNYPRGFDKILSFQGTLLLNHYNDQFTKKKGKIDTSDADVLQKAFEVVRASFKLNNNNPVALNHLCNLFFTQKNHSERDYGRIESYSKKAKSIALANGQKEVAAESAFYLARSYHSQGKYSQAMAQYKESLDISSKVVFASNLSTLGSSSSPSSSFPLPRYYLAQLYYYEGDYTNALDQLTRLDSKFPDCPEAKWFLGHIHSLVAMGIIEFDTPSSTSSSSSSSQPNYSSVRSNAASSFTLNPSASLYSDHYSKAYKCLTRCIQLNPSNIDAYLDLALLLERTNANESLTCYSNAALLTMQTALAKANIDSETIKQYNQQFLYSTSNKQDQDHEMKIDSVSLPPFVHRLDLSCQRMIWNNISVLRMQLGQDMEAHESLVRLLLLNACSKLANTPLPLVASSSIHHQSDPSAQISNPQFCFTLPQKNVAEFKKQASNFEIDPKSKSLFSALSSPTILEMDQSPQNLNDSEQIAAPTIWNALIGREITEKLSKQEISSIESYVLSSGAFLLPLNLTSSFNLALVYEKLKQFELAERIYAEILKVYPNYHDASLRLAYIYRDTHRIDLAENVLEKLRDGRKEDKKGEFEMMQIGQNISSLMAGLILANIKWSKKDYSQSKDLYDKLVDQLNAKRPTAVASGGNANRVLQTSSQSGIAELMMSSTNESTKSRKRDGSSSSSSQSSMMSQILKGKHASNVGSLSEASASLSKLDYYANEEEALIHAATQWFEGSDLYALTSYANFFLKTAYNSQSKEKNLKWAYNLFSTVLKHSPGNVYAANGLAIVNAMNAASELSRASKTTPSKDGLSSSSPSLSDARQHARQALNALLALREAVPSMPDFLVNLGHLSFAMGDFRSAKKHYQSVWSHGSGMGKFAQVLEGQVPLMLARCMAELGHFTEAQQTLQIALRHNPLDLDMWYNLAVLCKDWALTILKSTSTSSTDQENDHPSMDIDSSKKESSFTTDENHTHSTGSTKSNLDSAVFEELMELDSTLLESVVGSSHNASLHSHDNNDSLAYESEATDKMEVDGKPNHSSDAAKSKSKSPNHSPLVISSSVVSGPSEEEQEKAISLLNFAAPLFRKLAQASSQAQTESKSVSSKSSSTKGGSQHVLFSSTKCTKFAKLCEINMELGIQKLAEYRSQLLLVKEARNARIQMAKDEEAMQLEELKKLEEIEKEKLRLLNEEAEQARIKSEELLEQWASRVSSSGEDKRKKKNPGRKFDLLDSTENSPNASSDEDDHGRGSSSRIPDEDGDYGPLDDDKMEEIDAGSRKTRQDDGEEDDDFQNNNADEDLRKSSLEEMMAARRRQAELKRKHDQISSPPAPPPSLAATSVIDANSQIDTQNDGDDEKETTSEPALKKRKLVKNSSRDAAKQDDEDIDFAGIDD